MKKLFIIISNKIKNFFLSIKYAFQRMKYGSCEKDVYDIDDWFIRTLLPMLKYFKSISTGVPVNVSNEEWELILDKMIFCLTMMDSSNIKKFYQIKNPSRDLIESIKNRNKKHFFENFEKYFYYLWE